MGYSDKVNLVGITVDHCGAYIVGSGYGPHYLPYMKSFSGFILILVKE